MKRRRPATKSASLMLSVEAAKPATSTTAPLPKPMPLGLIRKTRPFDTSEPRMAVGSWPVTRLSTVLAACCWMKRVISSRAMENCCQLMIAPGVLVMVSVPPLTEKVTPPRTIVAPEGLANAEGVPAAKAAPMANASALRDGRRRAMCLKSRWSPERRQTPTYPPDPSTLFRRTPTFGCYAPA